MVLAPFDMTAWEQSTPPSRSLMLNCQSISVCLLCLVTLSEAFLSRPADSSPRLRENLFTDEFNGRHRFVFIISSSMRKRRRRNSAPLCTRVILPDRNNCNSKKRVLGLEVV